MDGQRDQWQYGNAPFTRTSYEGVSYLHHASQLEAQRADDCIGLASAGRWIQDSNLTCVQQGQYGKLERYSMQRAPRKAPDYCVEPVQENTVFAISDLNTAYGTTKDKCNPPTSIPNLSQRQEQNFPYQHSLPFYLGRQTEAGVANSSYYQNSNGFVNEFVPDPSVASKNDPWSIYNKLNGSQNSGHAKQVQVIAEQNASDATHSMIGHDDPDSVFPDHDGLESTMSNMSSECFRYPSQPPASECRSGTPIGFCSPSFTGPSHAIRVLGPEFSSRNRRQNSAERTPLLRTGKRQDSDRLYQDHYLPVPMQRRVSSASSLTTEATSSSAMSDNVSDVLTCTVGSCSSTFSGNFRKGNRRRHMKVQHSKEARTVVCKHCSKSFRRSDALLKHSKKKHPERAASAPHVVRSKGIGPRVEHPDHYE